MKSVVPRLLPLVGVAVVGVAALKMAGGVEGLSSLVNARASAEEASIPRGGLKKDEAPADPSTTPVQPPGALPTLPPAGQSTPPAGPIACAPSAAELAKQAGLSPGELQVIQTLGARRGQLDAREQALDTQLQLIAAAEQKVDGRIKAMEALKAEIQGLVGQVDAQQQAEIDRLVVVYEKMKPRDAGPLMAQLDDKVRIPVAAKMKPAALAQILASMGTAQAKVLSESLARRFTPAQSLASILDGKAPPPAPAPETKAAAPSQTAAAEPPKAAPAKPKPAPRRAPMKMAKAEAPPAPKTAVEPAAVAASGATTPSKGAAAPAAAPAAKPAAPAAPPPAAPPPAASAKTGA